MARFCTPRDMSRAMCGPSRNLASPLHTVGQRPRWEPSWEPFAVDGCGQVWTPVELKAFPFGLCERLWTPTDTPWRSTDQKVGGSSPSGRAAETPAMAGFLSSAAVFDLRGLVGSLPGREPRPRWRGLEVEHSGRCRHGRDGLCRVWRRSARGSAVVGREGPAPPNLAVPCVEDLGIAVHIDRLIPAPVPHDEVQVRLPVRLT